MTRKTLREPDSSGQADRPAHDGDTAVAEKPPEDSAIEAFEDEGAGIAAKE